MTVKKKSKVKKRMGGGSMMNRKGMGMMGGGNMVKKKAGGGNMVKKKAGGGNMVKKKAGGGNMIKKRAGGRVKKKVAMKRGGGKVIR